MALFKIEILDQNHTTIIVWKDRGSGKAALEWAQAQAIEIFGEEEASRYRYHIEEQPAA